MHIRIHCQMCIIGIIDPEEGHINEEFMLNTCKLIYKHFANEHQ